MNNILLCVTGLTPQIVTETLYCLSVKRKIKIDELFVITTERGVNVLEGYDEDKNTPRTSLKKEISEMCAKYNISLPKFNTHKYVIVAEEESYELPDILSDNDNKLFPNIVAEFIKEKTSDDNNVLYCSLSGGRKSMSAHFALVLSLFANKNDKLYHVVTSEKFEFGNFYPQTKEEEKALLIAEVPFVKLRALNAEFLNTALSYPEIIEKTQRKLDAFNDKLIIDLSKQKILLNNNKINLEARLITLYLLFVEEHINNGKGFSTSDLGKLHFANKLKLLLIKYFKKDFDDLNKEKDIDVIRSEFSKIKKAIKTLCKNDELKYDDFIISSKKLGGEAYYYLKADKNQFEIIYPE